MAGRGWDANWSAGFRSGAPVTAAVILDAVRSGAWRVVVGDAAKKLDEFVRANPEDAYDYARLARYRGE